MRGAVSVALVYLYYDPDGTSDDKQKSSLISATLTVVLFSTLVYGAITKPMLDLLLGAAGAQLCRLLSLALPATAQLCFALFRWSLSRFPAKSCGTAHLWHALSARSVAWRHSISLPGISADERAAIQEVAERRSGSPAPMNGCSSHSNAACIQDKPTQTWA